MAYELLTGQHPFRGETAMDTLNAIISRDHVPAIKLRPEVPIAISDLVDRCLRKQPGDRFSTAKEISERLDTAAAGIRTSTSRTAAERSGRPAAKWAGVLAAAALLIALAWFAARPWWGAGTAQTPIHSLAVMNIKVPAADNAGAIFSEELVHGLSSALVERGLQVAARSTVAGLDPSSDPRSLGESLKVDAVLQGDIRTVGSTVRLYFELVDARTGFVVWSRTTPLDASATVDPSEETAARLAGQIAAAAKGQQ